MQRVPVYMDPAVEQKWMGEHTHSVNVLAFIRHIVLFVLWYRQEMHGEPGCEESVAGIVVLEDCFSKSL
jgi:hypothetical protein